MEYSEFLSRKLNEGADHGFDPVFMPDCLFDFQKMLVEWAVRKGRAAIFSDCGTGKTFLQITWAENVARKTNGRVLILTPLAVSFQTVMEGQKLGVEITHRKDGVKPNDRIVVTNYERLHYFNPGDFAGVVCDESSILKNFSGATRQSVTDFMHTHQYRLLCTATAAPNDYIELGTSAEALSEMERKHMLARFFTHDGGETATWRLKGHARTSHFWRWVCGWARAMRKPSELGFEDGGFVLPPLTVQQHIVGTKQRRDGYLFDIPAVGLAEQRDDLRRSIEERCDMAAQLINAHTRPAVAWCNLNEEGNRLARSIRGAVEVCGSDSDEHKEETFYGFIKGDIRVLVTKGSIGGFGLNLQHCAHQTYFPSHSYEQYYQCVRRCWRFGQKNPVVVDMITTTGQENVLSNLQRKAEQASQMFDSLVLMMWKELRIKNENLYTKKEAVPSWL